MSPNALDIKTYKIKTTEEPLGRERVKNVKTVIKGKYMHLHNEPCMLL